VNVLPAITLALAQVLPWIVKVDPVGNWSLPPTSVVAPVVPPGWLAVSLTASITLAVAVVVLLAVLVLFSLTAPVVPVKVTVVVGSSAPPAVPGAW
jgi:hypothetical protein